MEVAGLLQIGAVVSAGAAAGLAAKAWLRGSEEKGRPKAARRALAGEAWGGKLAWRLRNGVGWTRPAAERILRLGQARRCAAEVVWHLRLRGLSATEESVASLFVAAVLALSVAALLITGSPLAVLAVVACAAAGSVAWAHSVEDARREMIRAAVPEALRSMSVCFQSGLSLLQALEHVARETPDPLGSLFARSAHRMELGEGAHGALEALRSGSSVPELAFVAVALDAQHQSGGSLRHVLDAARETVEGELELQRKLRVQTAQAKLSARVVSVMPFVLVAVFSLISEGFLDPFFESFQGMALLCVAFTLQLAGIMAVRATLRVEGTV